MRGSDSWYLGNYISSQRSLGLLDSLEISFYTKSRIQESNLVVNLVTTLRLLYHD